MSTRSDIGRFMDAGRTMASLSAGHARRIFKCSLYADATDLSAANIILRRSPKRGGDGDTSTKINPRSVCHVLSSS